jgi:hypothetical protein
MSDMEFSLPRIALLGWGETECLQRHSAWLHIVSSREQPSARPAERPLLEVPVPLVVSFHMRLTPSSWREGLAQISVASSALRTLHKSPTANRCCWPISAVTKASKAVRDSELSKLTGANPQRCQRLLKKRACIRGMRTGQLPKKPVSSYSFRLFASDLIIDPCMLCPCCLRLAHQIPKRTLVRLSACA